MTTELQYNVFLSHNQADKPRVRKLAQRLKQAGFNFVPRTSHLVFRNAVLFRNPCNTGRRCIPLRPHDGRFQKQVDAQGQRIKIS